MPVSAHSAALTKSRDRSWLDPQKEPCQSLSRMAPSYQTLSGPYIPVSLLRSGNRIADPQK